MEEVPSNRNIEFPVSFYVLSFKLSVFNLEYAILPFPDIRGDLLNKSEGGGLGGNSVVKPKSVC